MLENKLKLANAVLANVYLVRRTFDAYRFDQTKNPIPHSLVASSETLVVRRAGKILRIDDPIQSYRFWFIR
jgi:hypothetical protein